MKKALLFFILFTGFSLTGFGQKNVVTVPLAEVVQKKKVYDQPSAVVNKNIIQLSNILTYGFGGNFQGGITLIELTMNYGSGNFFPYDSYQPGMNPDVLVNLQKGFKHSDKSWIGIGTQSGVNISDERTAFSTFN